MKPDNDDSDDRLTMILIIVAVVMAVLIGASVSIIALRSRTCRKPHFEGQHSQKVIHNIKVRPITDLNIKGLHPEFRPKDHEYYIEFMDEKRRYSNNFKGGEGTQLADIRMQDININGLHSQLRAKDKLFYLRHPIMKQRGSELYQGTPDVKNGLKAPVQNRVSVDAPEYHYNDTDLSSSANAIQGIREFDNDNTRNDRIELYLKGITDYRNDHAKL